MRLDRRCRAGGRVAGPGVTAMVPAAAAEQAGGSRPGPARGGMPLRWALLVALAGGLALAAAFPPVGAWPLAVAGPALLTVALWRRSLGASLVVGNAHPMRLSTENRRQTLSAADEYASGQGQKRTFWAENAVSPTGRRSDLAADRGCLVKVTGNSRAGV